MALRNRSFTSSSVISVPSAVFDPAADVPDKGAMTLPAPKDTGTLLAVGADTHLA